MPSSGIQRVLDMMLREGSLTSRQVAFLMDLVDDKDSVLLAAFQVRIESNQHLFFLLSFSLFISCFDLSISDFTHSLANMTAII